MRGDVLAWFGMRFIILSELLKDIGDWFFEQSLAADGVHSPFLPGYDDDDCTGLAASWCPACGDCTCPRSADGEIEWHYEPGIVNYHGFSAHSASARTVVHYDAACPLHGESSDHAEGAWHHADCPMTNEKMEARTECVCDSIEARGFPGGMRDTLHGAVRAGASVRRG